MVGRHKVLQAVQREGTFGEGVGSAHGWIELVSVRKRAASGYRLSLRTGRLRFKVFQRPVRGRVTKNSADSLIEFVYAFLPDNAYKDRDLAASMLCRQVQVGNSLMLTCFRSYRCRRGIEKLQSGEKKYLPSAPRRYSSFRSPSYTIFRQEGMSLYPRRC